MRRFVALTALLIPLSLSAVELPTVQLVEPIKRETSASCENPFAEQWEAAGLSGVIDPEQRQALARKALQSVSKKHSEPKSEPETSGSSIPDYLMQ